MSTGYELTFQFTCYLKNSKDLPLNMLTASSGDVKDNRHFKSAFDDNHRTIPTYIEISY